MCRLALRSLPLSPCSAHVTTLSLAHCWLAHFLFPPSAHVTTLSLAHCWLDDAFAEEAAMMLETNTTLTELNLESNEFGGRGVYFSLEPIPVYPPVPPNQR